MLSEQTNLIISFLQFISNSLKNLRISEHLQRLTNNYQIEFSENDSELLYTVLKEKYLHIPVDIYIFYKTKINNKIIMKIKELSCLKEKNKIFFIYYKNSYCLYYYNIDKKKNHNLGNEPKLITHFIKQYMNDFLEKAIENEIQIDVIRQSLHLQEYIKNYCTKFIQEKEKTIISFNKNNKTIIENKKSRKIKKIENYNHEKKIAENEFNKKLNEIYNNKKAEFIKTGSDKEYDTEDYKLLEKKADNFLFEKEKEKPKNNIVNDKFLYKFNEDEYENLEFLLEKEKINSEYQLN
ncbi:45631_t:CDS:2, partial [Gigaspora margarita]